MNGKSTSGSTEPIPRSWRLLMGDEEAAKGEAVLALAAAGSYYPQGHVFDALKSVAPSDVKAVILGQDPYHGEGEANGLAFSVGAGVVIPPSLRNIFKELRSDLGIEPPPGSGDLGPWARNGVLLLNALLTVAPNKAGSHRYLGWEGWTDRLIGKLSDSSPETVFILWGNYAKKKRKLLREGALVVEGGHPSPLSANRGGFFGGRYFSAANSLRRQAGAKEIDWSLS